MTKRTNIVKIVAVVAILVIAISMIFVGCDKLKDAGKPEAEVGNKEVTLIIGQGEEYTTITVKTYQNYLSGLLSELQLRGKITYDSEPTADGTFIKSINNVVPQSASEFVGIYHDIDDVTLRTDQSNWPVPNKEYNGKEYYFSNVGADSLPVKEGHTYFLTLNVWGG